MATDSTETVARVSRSTSWFVVGRHAGVECTRVWAVAEQLTDLLHALSAQLADPVDLHLHDHRTGRRWQGALLPLSELRDELGRLRFPLAAFGGADVVLSTADDQLSLTPELLLVIYARTTRWAFLLDGLGVAERSSMPPIEWNPDAAMRRPAPALSAALAASANRLGLVEVTT